MNKFLYWLPRILGIGFTIFLSLFALDAFENGLSIGEMLLGFLIHMIPSFVLIAILLIAWKWEIPGGLLYVGAGIFYLVMARGMHWSTYLLISGPLFLDGILFFLHHFLFRKTPAVSI
ncbi:MAG: hypothetical protein GYA52_12295 [Chloroflexi bacterium]|nr:hypothetical protein [Chloroflexota bacterium]